MADLQVDSEDYAARIVRLLWPDQPTPGPETEAGSGLLALPSARTPRLLVPAAHRRAAASAARRYNLRPESKARLSTALLALGLQTGLLQCMLRSRSGMPGGTAQAGSITAHLRGVVSPTCVVAVYVGIPRGNRKPVLLALEPDGRLLAVAKLGTSALTRRLIVNESAALRRLAAARPSGVTVAEVLFAGEWGGFELLVQSALPKPGRMPSDAASQRDRAAASIAAVGGIERPALVTGPVLSRLDERVAVLPAGPSRDVASQALAELRRAVPELALAVGSWHGDWTPWNLAATATHQLMVWDWERFTSGVPIGYDALHYDAQVAGRFPGGPATALRGTRQSLGRLLAPYDLDPATHVPVFALYLLEMLVRYTEDDQAKLPAGRRWIDALTESLTHTLTEIRSSSRLEQRNAS